MPNRIIREGWLESPAIDQLDAQAERFFLRLCLRADDFGRYHALPQLLKSNLFPLRDDVRATEIPRWLTACQKAGLVRCYQAEGKPFLQIEKFDQRMRAANSKFPAPPPIDGQMTVICQPDDSPPRSEAETESKTESESHSELPAKAEKVTAEQIYQCYPKKSGKQSALVEISKAMKLKPAEYLIERVILYAEAVAKWPPGTLHFAPDPERWFKRGKYDDDPVTWVRNEQHHDDRKQMNFARE